MSDDAAQVQIEDIPSINGGISAIASSGAPFIYFENVPFYGHVNGVGMFTLTAQRQIGVLPDGGVATDNVITCLLRGNVQALIALKTAIDGILLLAMPKPEGELN